MQLFDTLCHLHNDAFDDDREAVLKRARAAGVERLLLPAVDASQWDSMHALCERHRGLYAAFGLHPMYLERHDDGHLEALREAVERYKPVALGEIGLDFYIDNPDRDGQQRLFEAQLKLARDCDLPVVLHVRKAHDEVLATLRRIRVKGGTAHAFNGSLQQAEQYIELGFRLGFGGTLTFERSKNIRRLAADVPLDAIVLETDAPDMSGAAHRGERNSPEYLPEVLQALSEVRDESLQELARCTSANAAAVFGVSQSE